MHAALSYLEKLPNETVVYSGHEYTAANLAFAKSIDPTNPGISRLAKLVQENEITTGLSTIGDEKEWNVFMRLDSEVVKYVAPILLIFNAMVQTLFLSPCRQATGVTEASAIMDRLREMKNEFRG
jgi:hydroxyacylglutathione hydrolase